MRHLLRIGRAESKVILGYPSADIRPRAELLFLYFEVGYLAVHVDDLHPDLSRFLVQLLGLLVEKDTADRRP